MEVKLLWTSPEPSKAIEYAARLCYDSHDKIKEGSAAKLVRACINKGHYSITEHSAASFHVSGVSRSLLAQITRHRQLSFCVRSQRYCKEDGSTFVPAKFDDEQMVEFEAAMDNAQQHYDTLISMGAKAEDARAVLPNACATEFVVTANFRAWYEFLQKRQDRAAQKEIRDLADMIHSKLVKISPDVFE